MADFLPVPGRLADAAKPVDLQSMSPGTHLCALYSSDAEQARVGASFVAAGLAAGDRVLYVADDFRLDPVRDFLAAAGIPAATAAAGGQLVFRGFGEMYGAAHGLDLNEVASGFRGAAAQARADGFPALRVAAEMGDFARYLGSADRVVTWERMSTRLQHEEGISSVCQYDRRQLDDSGAAALRAAHDAAAPEHAVVPLASYLSTGAESGLRVTGELDLTNRGDLARVLRARLAVSSRLRLDASGLSFADAGTVRELYQAAERLPADGLITVVDAQPGLRRAAELSGLRHPQLLL